jgi:hypothetical protein
MPLHNFNLRMLAEDLVRVRRPDDRERYAASQRQARIDPNPHEVVGSTGRDRVEAEIVRLAYNGETLERRIAALESREDEVYRKWRNEYHDLRYRAPKVTRLFQVVGGCA